MGGSGSGVRASLHHSEEDVNGESPSVVEDSPTGTLLGTVVHGGDCIKVIEVPKAAISQGKGGRGLKRRSSRLDDGEIPAKKSKTDSPHGLCGVVWCGVVWCAVVWCGVVWCGVWCGVVWCGVV